MTLDRLEGILAEALTLNGCESARFSSNGIAALNVRGMSLGLELQEGSGRLCLYTCLCALPSSLSVPFLEFLLECNMMGQETGGGHIGLHAPTRSLIFSLTMEAEGMDAPRLAGTLTRFTEKAAELMAETEKRSRTEESLPFMANVIWA